MMIRKSPYDVNMTLLSCRDPQYPRKETIKMKPPMAMRI